MLFPAVSLQQGVRGLHARSSAKERAFPPFRLVNKPTKNVQCFPFIFIKKLRGFPMKTSVWGELQPDRYLKSASIVSYLSQSVEVLGELVDFWNLLARGGVCIHLLSEESCVWNKQAITTINLAEIALSDYFPGSAYVWDTVRRGGTFIHSFSENFIKANALYPTQASLTDSHSVNNESRAFPEIAMDLANWASDYLRFCSALASSDFNVRSSLFFGFQLLRVSFTYLVMNCKTEMIDSHIKYLSSLQNKNNAGHPDVGYFSPQEAIPHSLSFMKPLECGFLFWSLVVGVQNLACNIFAAKSKQTSTYDKRFFYLGTAKQVSRIAFCIFSLYYISSSAALPRWYLLANNALKVTELGIKCCMHVYAHHRPPDTESV